MQNCPQCRSPLYGRFVPAPSTTQISSRKSGSGGGIVLGIIGAFLFLGVAGAGAYALLGKKGDSTTASAPPASAGIPVLADTSAPDGGAVAIPSASGKKPVPIVKGPDVKPTPTPNPFPTGAPTPAPTPTPTPAPTPTAISSGFLITPRPTASANALNNPNQNTRCSATVSVGKFRPSSSTCSFNEKVSTGPSKVDFPCEGGAASATFGTQTFRGTVTATSLSISNVDQFTFSGCRVESTQRITGSRSSTSGFYTYSERILSGSCSGVRTCTATAPVEFR